jgi:hypothetical protein
MHSRAQAPIASDCLRTRKREGSENAKRERHFYEESRKPGTAFSGLPEFLDSLPIINRPDFAFSLFRVFG